MSTAQRPFPECGFRFSLVEDGIVFEATAEVRDRLQTYFIMRAAGAHGAMYDGKSFHPEMAKPWGYGGNIHPREAEEGRFAWLAPWPTVGKPPFPETKVLSASLAVLSACLLIVMDEQGWYRGKRVPLFLPDLMEPMGGMHGAALNAEFCLRVTRWIGPAKGRSVPEVAAAMRQVTCEGGALPG